MSLGQGQFTLPLLSYYRRLACTTGPSCKQDTSCTNRPVSSVQEALLHAINNWLDLWDWSHHGWGQHHKFNIKLVHITRQENFNNKIMENMNFSATQYCYYCTHQLVYDVTNHKYRVVCNSKQTHTNRNSYRSIRSDSFTSTLSSFWLCFTKIYHRYFARKVITSCSL